MEFRPEILYVMAKSLTTLSSRLISWFTSFFLVYVWPVSGQKICASNNHHTFMPYLAGFNEIYWINCVLLRYGSSYLSTLKFSVGLYFVSKFLLNITSWIKAALKFWRRSAAVFWSWNTINKHNPKLLITIYEDIFPFHGNSIW